MRLSKKAIWWERRADAGQGSTFLGISAASSRGNAWRRERLVSAHRWGLQRPDGQWSVMLVNKDQNQDHAVRVSFEDSASKQERALSGPVDEIVFGTAQYQWHADTAVELVRGKGHASPDGPPLKSRMAWIFELSN